MVGIGVFWSPDEGVSGNSTGIDNFIGKGIEKKPVRHGTGAPAGLIGKGDCSKGGTKKVLSSVSFSFAPEITPMAERVS